MKKILLISTIAIALTLTACNYSDKTSTSSTPVAVNLTTTLNKQSYAMGFTMGKKFKTNDINLAPDAYMSGLSAALAGKKGQMTEKQIKQTLEDWQKSMMAQAQAKEKVLAVQNSKSSALFMQKISKLKGVKQIKNTGIYYTVDKAGTGMKPSATDTVTVNYEGKLSTGKIFDSSYQRGKPATFAVNQVIPGWTTTLENMPAGSTWTVYIPADLAYGKMASPNIGPNQALQFKIELISIKKSTPQKKAAMPVTTTINKTAATTTKAVTDKK